jgi:hypothetical protein
VLFRSERTCSQEGTWGSLVASVEQSGQSASVTFLLDPTSDRFLTEHKQLGRPLLPAVMGLELMAQAAIAWGQLEQVREIQNFFVERPIAFPVDVPRSLRVELVSGEGSVATEASIYGALVSGDGRMAQSERIHVRAELRAELSDPVAGELDEKPFPFNPMIYQEDAPIWHGPAFRTLAGLFLERSGGWGKLKAPDMEILAAPRGALGWTVPAALLDGCMVGCAVYSYILLGKRVEVPVAFDRLRFFDLPATGEVCTVRMLYKMHSDTETQYDFTLYGADERVLIAVDTLHLAVVVKGRT